MKRRILLATATAVLAAGGAFGLISPAQAHGGPPAYVVRDHAPPAPRYEHAPPPRAGNVWVPGGWRAVNDRYEWNRGHWQAARAGYRFVPERWVRTPGGWQMRPGHWAR